MDSKPSLNLLVIAVLIIIIAGAVYMYYSTAKNFENLELSGFPNNKGYVSDEVWYVNSARNILRKIFGLTPHMNPPRASIILSSYTDVYNAKNLAKAYSIKILADENYFSKIRSEENRYVIYVEAPSKQNIESFAKAVNALEVVYGWLIGDARGVYEYLNLEHPPTVKYIIAMIMLIMGDRPLYWRIPSIVMGAVVVATTFFIVYELTKIPELGLIAAAATAVDPMTKVMSSIALLDIYVSAFTVLTLYLAIKGRFKGAALLLGFASTIKFSSLLAAIPLLFIYMNNMFKKGYRTLKVIEESIYYIILMILSFVFFQILMSTPIILGLGLGTWLNQGLFGSIQWHLSVKCVGPQCPIASAPWEWFMGINSFPIYASPAIYAQGFTPTYALALLLMVLSIPTMVRDRPTRTTWYMIVGVFLGYLAIWILGGRSQYSFYAIQLTPLIYSYLAVQLYEIIRRENLKKIIDSWRNVIIGLAKIIFSFFR
ncbi:MAG: glycosyltransferase family 39 protein [Ignisphaera sp.]